MARNVSQGTESVPFDVGGFRCVAVSDGTLAYALPTFPPPPVLLFANAPREELAPALHAEGVDPAQWAAWTSDYTCLLVETGVHRVLVDTGAGALAPTTGRLLHNLAQQGIAPQGIDAVVLTHGHPDHIGGNTDSAGNVVFPGVRFFMSKDEWDFWTAGRAERELDEHMRPVLMESARRNLLPLREQVEFVAPGQEFLPGMRALPAPGHTPGHMALELTSQGRRLLCISDAALHPLHVAHPEWCAVVDSNPPDVVATRRRLFDLAARENTLVFAFHFPFPGLGHVQRRGEAFAWQPAEQAG